MFDLEAGQLFRSFFYEIQYTKVDQEIQSSGNKPWGHKS